MNTAQEQAWRGKFGSDYQRRSPGDEQANYHFFERALNLGAHRRRPGQAVRPESIVELGAGMGANLRALSRLLPESRLAAVEINEAACQTLMHPGFRGLQDVYNYSLLDWEPERTWDLAFTKGVLIHIHPDELRSAYEVLHRAAGRWILIAEYYNPTPQMIPYRGEEDRLWKRDFAGEMLDRYPDLRMVDYGFVWKRDAAPQDDVTWFLLEKVQEVPHRQAAGWPFPT